jgi:hypothetical protein
MLPRVDGMKTTVKLARETWYLRFKRELLLIGAKYCGFMMSVGDVMKVRERVISCVYSSGMIWSGDQ